MKCLMLLVLVAVCQGIIVRDPQQRKEHVESQQDQLRHVIEKYIPTIKLDQESPQKEFVGLERQLEQRVLPKSKPQIQEQRQKLEKPRVQEFLGRNLEQSPLKSSSQLWKRLEKSPLQFLRLNTPFIQYSKPTTFLDYIKTFRTSEPWNQMTSVYPNVLDFKNFRDLIQFPGGDFLQDEIDKCLWNMPEDTQVFPTNEFTTRLPFDTNMQIDMRKVEGVRDVLPFILTQLEKMVPLYMETTNDPSTMAMLVTRDLIKIVLHGRMKCPTTAWDKYFIENLNDQLYKTTNEEKHLLLENFRTLLPDVLPEVLPEVPDLINQLVYTITQDVQDHVCKDVMQYAHGAAFKDVAILTHKLYHEVKQVFKESWQQDVPVFMQQLVTVVTELITDYGTCPREHPIYNKNKLACWDFNKLFLECEVSTIHSRVMNIVHHYLYHTCSGEQCMQHYPRVTEVFRTIIQQYIATIIQRVPMCQTPECLDPTNCLFNKHQFQDYSRIEEAHKIPMWYTLQKVINRDHQL